MTRKQTEEVEQWLKIRKEAALKIDPQTAKVDWWYGQTLDPYRVHADLPEELRQVGREYFARSPGTDVWVWFGDLPEKVRDELWERHKSKLAFPAGLENASAHLAQIPLWPHRRGMSSLPPSPRRRSRDDPPKRSIMGRRRSVWKAP
jgi:hypothetical protein